MPRAVEVRRRNATGPVSGAVKEDCGFLRESSRQFSTVYLWNPQPAPGRELLTNFHLNGGSVNTQFRNMNSARLLEFGQVLFLVFSIHFL